MDNLCRLCTIIRGGQLLNQIILLEENESNEQKKQFYRYECSFIHSFIHYSFLFLICRDVLDKTCKEYFQMMQDYIYYGQVNDYFNVLAISLDEDQEFMIVYHRKEVSSSNQIINEFELNPRNVIIYIFIHSQELSAISSSNAKILLSGHYINIVLNTGAQITNPVYKEWKFDYNVTIYNEYVISLMNFSNESLMNL